MMSMKEPSDHGDRTPYVVIRPGRPVDVETIKALTVAAFDGVSIDQNIERWFGNIGEHDWRWRKARHIDDDFAAPDGMTAVAEYAAGEIVGYITMRIDREARVGTIPNLAVRVDHRGGGIGRMLLEHALEIFRGKNLVVARIETLEQNAVGSHLYPQLGFVEVARQIHYARLLDGESSPE